MFIMRSLVGGGVSGHQVKSGLRETGGSFCSFHMLMTPSPLLVIRAADLGRLYQYEFHLSVSLADVLCSSNGAAVQPLRLQIRLHQVPLD